MNGAVRRDIAFSRHASVALFECLIVAGAPATGLLQGGAFIGDAVGLQKSLELIRDMWRRADTLYVYLEDLESLHRTECRSTGRSGSPVPEAIAREPRKLARVCTNYPSAPPALDNARIPAYAAEPRSPFREQPASHFPFRWTPLEQQRRAPPSSYAHGEQRKAPEQQHLPQQQQQVQLSLSPRTDSALPEYHGHEDRETPQKHARRLQQLYPPLHPGTQGSQVSQESKSFQTRGGKSQRVASENGMSGCYDSNDESGDDLY
ncbi:hypothetical protein Q5P01_000206 [Channa striata]|uniref:Uncharacterized protein n=1 Tax=Channa striata TaxID=64152 RepID=A0AA88IFQ9_CHASR|nr:hypothetical protein Q5P01_000206 [Channa striata]